MTDDTPEDWVELAPGFYIVEETGTAHDTDAMRRQADEMYERVREAFEGKIEFVEDGDE